jgi:hypothetical protein
MRVTVADREVIIRQAKLMMTCGTKKRIVQVVTSKLE